MEDTRKIIKLPGLEPEPEQPERLNNAVPAETRLKWLVKEQGKLLSYIDELEFTIKSLKAEIRQLNMQTVDERKEMKRQATYTQLRETMSKLEKEVGKLRRDNESLIMRLHNKNQQQ
jgi:predicted RNase H-like nuclease (RuvC/YqgF family)